MKTVTITNLPDKINTKQLLAEISAEIPGALIEYKPEWSRASASQETSAINPASIVAQIPDQAEPAQLQTIIEAHAPEQTDSEAAVEQQGEQLFAQLLGCKRFANLVAKVEGGK